MGMFTQIDLDDGSDIQIKCGRDFCDHYRIGDEVHWYPDPDSPGEGKLLDDVYDGLWSSNLPDDDYDKFEDRWVVIKDHRVVAVLPVERNSEEPPENSAGFYPRNLKGGYEGQTAHLRAQYGIQPLPPETWSQEAWAKKAIKEYEREEEKRRGEAEMYGMTPQQRMAHSVGKWTKARLSEPSFAERIFPLVAVE